MDVFALTRSLIDIESITNNEEAVGNHLYGCLSALAARFGGQVERMEVEPRRFNVFGQWGDQPTVTLSTHMDTVPPFFASREDSDRIYGRGACDTKGIIASMITAAEALLQAGVSAAARSAVPDQRRTDREQAGAGIQRSLAV